MSTQVETAIFSPVSISALGQWPSCRLCRHGGSLPPLVETGPNVRFRAQAKSARVSALAAHRGPSANDTIADVGTLFFNPWAAGKRRCGAQCAVCRGSFDNTIWT